jgi:hypothetical protein
MVAAKKKVEIERTSITLPSDEEVDEFAELMAKDAKGSLKIVEEVTVKTVAEHEFACNALKEVAHRYDVIDAKRKEWTHDLRKLTDKINKSMKQITDPLKKAEEILKEKIGGFRVSFELERKRWLREHMIAAQSGDVEKATKLLNKAEAFVVVDIPGVTGKTVWTGEVTDADALPRDYLMPNLALLHKLTEALGDDPEIPGWRAFPEGAVRTTRKGGES